MLKGLALLAPDGGANQTQIGLAVTQYTHGKFENINGATALNELLLCCVAWA